MSPNIARIEPTGPGLRARRIVLDDTSERVTAAAAVKLLGLEAGDAFDAEQLDEALLEVEPGLARERALRQLGQRERSAAELERRLTDAGFPRQVASDTVRALERVGIIDDARFAEIWTRSHVATGHGARLMRRELAERGIDAEVAESALSAALDDVDEVSRARSFIGSRVPKDRKERERLLRRLLSKGYDISVAIRALDADALLGSDEVTLEDE